MAVANRFVLRERPCGDAVMKENIAYNMFSFHSFVLRGKGSDPSKRQIIKTDPKQTGKIILHLGAATRCGSGLRNNTRNV